MKNFLKSWTTTATLKLVSGLCLVGALVACGGGGGNTGDPVVGNGPGGSGGGGTIPVADLSVILDKSTVANSSAGEVAITVTSLDGNRNALGGAPVAFSIDNGGVITPEGNKTAETTGLLKAVATIGSDRTSRTIKVTVASGSVSKVVSFDVVDSVTGGKVADLAMKLGSATIPNDGSENLSVTITSLDASRQAVGGSPVSLKIADTGDAFVSAGASGVTDATTGQLTATVSLASVKTNRTISLTATSGTVTRTVTFDVVDPLVSAAVASDLSLVLDKTNIGNAGSEFVGVTVTAVNSLRNVVAGIPVVYSVDNGATIAVLNGTTDAQGQSRAEVRIGDDRSNRTITVVANSGALTRSAKFFVRGISIKSTALPSLPIASSASNKVEYRVVDSNQAPMVGIPVVVSGAGLATVTGVTDTSGQYDFIYTAPAALGPLTIKAEAAGSIKEETVTVTPATSSAPPAIGPSSPPNLAIVPSVVPVNTGTDTTNRAEVRALFLAPTTNAPIQNIRVRFDLDGDKNNIGGVFSAGTATVLTDASGLAVTSYIAGTRASAPNGVTVRACWDYTDFGASLCPNASFTTLTVVSDPLSVTIGTDNTIQSGPTGLTYVKRFVVQVVDAAGNPKADVQLTPLLELLTFRKGFYQWNPAASEWQERFFDERVTDNPATQADERVTPAVGPICPKEDVNDNGTIDTGDDRNANGQLDPRKSDVSISIVGGTKTDANGTAVLKVEYPKSLAGWVDVKISVTAAGVLSPPAVNVRRLDIEAGAIKTESPPPSFVVSPFGIAVSSGTTSLYPANGSTCLNTR